MPQYIFTPEKAAESFAKNFPGMAAEMDENDVTPEDLAGYLNLKIDQSGRQALAAMFEDHIISNNMGVEITIRERRSFEEWKEKTGWEPSESPEE